MKLTLPTFKTQEEAWKALREQTAKFSPAPNRDGVIIPMTPDGKQLMEAGIFHEENGTFTPYLIIRVN